MKKKLIPYILLLLITCITFISCEKPPEEEDPRILQEDKDLVLETGTDLESTCWNIYCYAKQIYLWNDALPSIKEFDPKKYAKGMEKTPNLALHNLINAIAQYSNGEDRWSHISEDRKLIASVNQNGGAYRLAEEKIGYMAIENRYPPYNPVIAHVYPDSPAGKAGLKRGDLLIDIRTVDDKIYDLSLLRNGKSIRATIQATVFEKKLTSKLFALKKDNTTKQIGYLLLNQFNPSDMHSIDEVFKRFKIASVTELILDLRYNGGGQTEMIDFIYNLIIPSELQSSLIRSMEYNKTIRTGNASLLATHQKDLFKYTSTTSNKVFIAQRRTNALDGVKNIYFIVSSLTASASEMLIHSLKFYADKGYFGLKLIGKQTSGKGIGSFPITVDKYKVSLMSFRNWNAKFENAIPPEGFNPTYNSEDNLKHELMADNEECFAGAIRYIQGDLDSWNWAPFK